MTCSATEYSPRTTAGRLPSRAAGRGLRAGSGRRYPSRGGGSAEGIITRGSAGVIARHRHHRRSVAEAQKSVPPVARRCSDKHRRAGPCLPGNHPDPGGLNGRGAAWRRRRHVIRRPGSPAAHSANPGRRKPRGSRRLPWPARAAAPREDTTESEATEERGSKDATRRSSSRESVALSTDSESREPRMRGLSLKRFSEHYPFTTRDPCSHTRETRIRATSPPRTNRQPPYWSSRGIGDRTGDSDPCAGENGST